MLTSGRPFQGVQTYRPYGTHRALGVVLSYKHTAPLELKTGPSVTFQKVFDLLKLQIILAN